MEVKVREIVMQPSLGRGDRNFVFFESGKLSTPLFILTELEANRLATELIDELTSNKVGKQ